MVIGILMILVVIVRFIMTMTDMTHVLTKLILVQKRMLVEIVMYL